MQKMYNIWYIGYSRVLSNFFLDEDAVIPACDITKKNHPKKLKIISIIKYKNVLLKILL